MPHQRKHRQQPVAAVPAEAAATAAVDEGPSLPRPLALARFIVLQHGGLVLCVAGILLLILGYEAEWMHKTHLSLLSLALCLVGLFLHETRPVNVSESMQGEP